MSGLGLTQMNSLLASQNTLKTVSNLSAHRTALKGEMGVLGAEIEADKGRGVDTAAKEERYGTIEENANGIMEQIADTTGGLNDRIADENERIREEEAAKTSEITKTGKTPGDTKSGEAGTDGISANSDTVEISAFARNVAASAPQLVPEITTGKTVQVGEIVNVKA